ncbi:MAG: DUF1592 domain-containing protein [Bryobacteraceae bacterium]
MYGICVAASAADPVFDETVRPFLAKNCALCHNTKMNTAGLNVEAPREDTWANILERLRTGQMPPKGLPRPPAAEVQQVTAWIQARLEAAERDRKPDPGRVTAHRLNRFEYNNTIHDLLAVDFRPADNFPADDSGYGFDNIGDVLSLSPVLMEKYLDAAETIARLAIPIGPTPRATLDKLKADPSRHSRDLDVQKRFPVAGDYEFRISVTGRRPAKKPQTVKVALWVDGQLLRIFEREVDREQPRMFETRISLAAGDRDIKAVLLLADPDEGDPSQPEDRKPFVEWIETRGPFHAGMSLPPSYHRIFGCGHAPGAHRPECARKVVEALARRAWRRPVTESEIRSLVRFVDMAQREGDSFDQGVRLALEAVLVSPHFLFRVERDPDPNNAAAAHTVDNFELASRLSYFLWSSMPDDELLAAAQEGSLRRPEGLEAQVRRMMRDPKSKQLVANFAGQWLELRNLDSIRPDPDKFPEFDSGLRDAMRQETTLFFNYVMREDRSILDFIDGSYSFLNERLARLYGIQGVDGDQFRRVDLSGAERSGVLTQASILTVSSYPTRTSPVLRGKWLLENVLGTPPPPPPPDAGALDEDQVNLNGTVREQFEKHRSKPACFSCHSRMDPLGFGLENYDAIGRYRTHEGKFPVDASGTLPDGRSFNGSAQLKAILKADHDAFAHCLAEKMLTYALGRGLEPYDRPAVAQICRKLATSDYRFSSLILGIVNSLPFQMRRGEAASVTIAQGSAAGGTR